MFKNLKLSFEQIILFLLIGYTIFNRLIEQSGSQALLKETEQKTKNAEALSQQALMRAKAIEQINNELYHEIDLMREVNEITLDEITGINKRYKLKKDSLYKKMDDRLYRAKESLNKLQKLQKQL